MTISVAIPTERIYDLIITANESGSGYWARLIDTSLPEAPDLSWMKDPEDLDRWPQHGAALVGGSVTYGVLDDHTGEVTAERHTLNAESVASGLRIMQEKYPRHFGDFTAENEDAITSDVFLQCCLLGKVEFG